MTEPTTTEAEQPEPLPSAPYRGPRWVAAGRGIDPQHQPAWAEWLAFYGLPMMYEIPVGAKIIFDSDTRTITTERKTDRIGGRNEMLYETVTVVVPRNHILRDFPPGLEVTVE